MLDTSVIVDQSFPAEALLDTTGEYPPAGPANRPEGGVAG
jgi:hypothetical protein